MRPSRLLASALLAAALAPSPAARAAEMPWVPIQPGARLRVPGTCTANFVFSDATSRYIGTAGHCAPVGRVVADEAGARIGTVVFSVNNYPSLDFALIEIDPERYGDVSPSMRIWGGPTGIAPTGPFGSDAPRPGTLLRQFGYGTTWREHEATRSRSGVLSAWPVTVWEGYLPCSGGDSGSAVILASGEALGVLDVALLAPGGLDPQIQALIGKVSPSCGGSTLVRILERLRMAGYEDIELETAPLAPLI